MSTTFRSAPPSVGTKPQSIASIYLIEAINHFGWSSNKLTSNLSKYKFTFQPVEHISDLVLYQRSSLMLHIPFTLQMNFLCVNIMYNIVLWTVKVFYTKNCVYLCINNLFHVLSSLRHSYWFTECMYICICEKKSPSCRSPLNRPLWYLLTFASYSINFFSYEDSWATVPGT